ncbi:hypothetical protein [Hazenella coriacea]|uniref:Uncharacterized protein n=1 Tax=Hazenella coriacea TaxID=1179467 RepID=A0A4R3LDG0_9BACL|nr:hypothetical protein [Hazenella coriacea]TCS95516.1 hypothetical protein EDD58_10289 [Hazenella coriacea]
MDQYNRMSTPEVDRFQELDVGAQLADIKLTIYQQSLMLTALIDLLVSKGYLQQEELSSLAKRLDHDLHVSLDDDYYEESDE